MPVSKVEGRSDFFCYCKTWNGKTYPFENMKRKIKGKLPRVPSHGITIQKLEFLCSFSKAAEKNQSCFGLDTELWDWPGSAVTVQIKENFFDLFCLYTLPLARPAEAKIQMLTVICSIVTLIPWNLVNPSHLYHLQTGKTLPFGLSL